MRKNRPAPLQTAPRHPVSKMASGSSSWQLPTVTIAPTPSGSLQNLWGMHTLSWWWLWLFSAHQELVSIPQRLKQAFSPGGIPAGSCSCSRKPPAGCSRLQSSFLGPPRPFPGILKNLMSDVLVAVPKPALYPGPHLAGWQGTLQPAPFTLPQAIGAGPCWLAAL